MVYFLQDKEYISNRVSRLQRHAQSVADSLRVKVIEIKVMDEHNLSPSVCSPPNIVSMHTTHLDNENG